MQPPCGHFNDCGRVDGGCCDLDLYGGKPSYGVCWNVCGNNPEKGKMPQSELIQVRVPTAEQLAKAEAARNEVTRDLWRKLHTTALAGNLTPEWLNTFAPRLPCGDCQQHWTSLLKEIPPVFGAGSFEWSVTVHNAVNRRLGKPEWTVEDARSLYSLNE